MSKQSERLLVQLGEIRAETIEEADEDVSEPAGKRPTWKRWAALAAGLAIVLLTAGVLSGVIPFLRLGGDAGNVGVNPSGDGPTTFMSYAGPVFPLTLREENGSITAERDVTLDFLPWTPEWQSEENVDMPEEYQALLENYDRWFPNGGHYRTLTDILVTDSYTLTNTAGEAQTVSVLYPFAGSLYDLPQALPVLFADGNQLDTALYAGVNPGGDMRFLGNAPVNEPEPGGARLSYPNSWEDYRDTLTGKSYLTYALEGYSDLSGVSATVYEFTDAWGEAADYKAGRPNPTIRAEYDIDVDRTVMLSFGFNGGSYNWDTGHMTREYSIPQSGESRYGETCYLIAVGEDLRNLTTQGYATGGSDTKETIEAGVTVLRYETNLETILRTTAQTIYQGWQANSSEIRLDVVGFEMYFRMLKGWLLSDGPLSGGRAGRSHTGSLEDNDVLFTDRVFYLEAEVTVPAGGSVELSAAMCKEGSFDYYCARTGNKGVYGYDLVTGLGSNLTCTGQRATIEDRGLIEIVRQNFGFDLKNGVRTVDLDPKQEHYYLEVRGSKK